MNQPQNSKRWLEHYNNKDRTLHISLSVAPPRDILYNSFIYGIFQKINYLPRLLRLLNFFFFFCFKILTRPRREIMQWKNRRRVHTHWRTQAYCSYILTLRDILSRIWGYRLQNMYQNIHSNYSQENLFWESESLNCCVSWYWSKPTHGDQLAWKHSYQTHGDLSAFLQLFASP